METWRLLAGLSVLIVIWYVIVTLLGHRPGPFELAFGLVFAAVGLYLGEVLSNRLRGD